MTERLGAMRLDIYPMSSKLDESVAVEILDEARAVMKSPFEELYSNFDSINSFELHDVGFRRFSRHRRRTLGSHDVELGNNHERFLDQDIKSFTIIYVKDVEMNFLGFDKPTDHDLKQHADEVINERQEKLIDMLQNYGLDDPSQLEMQWVDKLPKVINEPDPDALSDNHFPRKSSNSTKKLKIIVPLTGVAFLAFITAFFLSKRQKRFLAANSLRVHDESTRELHGLDYIYAQNRLETFGHEDNKAYYDGGFPISMRKSDENAKEMKVYRNPYELEDQGIEITVSDNGDTVSSLHAEENHRALPFPPYLTNLFDGVDCKNTMLEGKETNIFESRLLGDVPNQQSSDSLRYSSSSLQTSRDSENEDSKYKVNDFPLNSTEKTSSSDSLEDLLKYEEDSTFRDLMTKE